MDLEIKEIDDEEYLGIANDDDRLEFFVFDGYRKLLDDDYEVVYELLFGEKEVATYEPNDRGLTVKTIWFETNAEQDTLLLDNIEQTDCVKNELIEIAEEELKEVLDKKVRIKDAYQSGVRSVKIKAETPRFTLKDNNVDVTWVNVLDTFISLDFKVKGIRVDTEIKTDHRGNT